MNNTKKNTNLIIAAGAGLAAAFAVNTVRAVRFKPEESPVEAYGPENVDVDKYARDLSDAIRIKTIANIDPSLTAWDEFERFRELLKERFPLMFGRLELRTFLGASLMFRWAGSRPDLEPIALLGHQDVVPISDGTWDDWKYPPFDGYNDGEFIWGRGALDMKNHLIAVCEAVETLLAEGFEPERDVYLCFGHNEEVMAGGPEEGASTMAKWFEDNGIRLDSIIDEGGAILPVDVPHLLKCKLASIGVAEKGYADFEISVEAKGGHSSQPPKHTALGELADVIKDIEGHQFGSVMTDTVYSLFSQIGRHMTLPGRMLACNIGALKPLILKIMEQIPPAASMIRTTTGVTMASGSPQANVLPQKASVTVNFRIMPGQSVADVERHLRKVIRNKNVKIRNIEQKAKEPSKVSPTDSESFNVISRICRSMNSDVIVAPYLVMGGTDACRYEAVCDNIYRYSPFLMRTELLLTTHGTNERLPVSALKNGVVFFKRYIREASKAARA